jgi:hypothetical protein
MEPSSWIFTLSCIIILLTLSLVVPAFGSGDHVSNSNQTEHEDNEGNNDTLFLLLLPYYYCEKASDCEKASFTNSNLICNTTQKLCRCPNGLFWNEITATCYESMRCITDTDCLPSYRCSGFECIPDAGPTATGFYYLVLAIPILVGFCYCFKFICRDSVPPAHSRDCSPEHVPPARPPRRSASSHVPVTQAREAPQSYSTISREYTLANNSPPPPYEVAINLPKVALNEPVQAV